jgi:predicted NAD/FAD-dependent oxidoreductase
VTVFEKSRGPGGRTSTRHSEFGDFDHGAQYFTIRSKAFARAINATTPEGMVLPWSASESRGQDARYVAVPGMSALVKFWAAPLGANVLANHTVQRITEHSHGGWEIQCAEASTSTHVDAVLLAIPNVQAAGLLSAAHEGFAKAASSVEVSPCWTLMLAYPNAEGAGAVGPSWHSSRPNHPRIAWVTREASKPGRGPIERWTVQATPQWSAEHLEDDAATVRDKLIKAFAEVTGIRAQPSHAEIHRWRYAKTQKPLDHTHLWDAEAKLGVCGDWCLGHRVEDAFTSGLSAALAIHKSLK